MKSGQGLVSVDLCSSLSRLMVQIQIVNSFQSEHPMRQIFRYELVRKTRRGTRISQERGSSLEDGKACPPFQPRVPSIHQRLSAVWIVVILRAFLKCAWCFARIPQPSHALLSPLRLGDAVTFYTRSPVPPLIQPSYPPVPAFHITAHTSNFSLFVSIWCAPHLALVLSCRLGTRSVDIKKSAGSASLHK